MENIIIPGSGTQLHSLLTRNEDPTAPVGLLLAPDPQWGGNMHHSVMKNLHEAFERAGATTMRVDYRNVLRPNKPRERWEDCIDEITDAAVAIRYLRQTCPQARQLWLGGYSFGAWVALQLVIRRPDLTGFVAVSPLHPRVTRDEEARRRQAAEQEQAGFAVTSPARGKNKSQALYDEDFATFFSFVEPCPASGLFVTGRADKKVTPRVVNRMIRPLTRQKHTHISHRIIPVANHYYRRGKQDLVRSVERYLNRQFKVKPTP